MVDWPQTGADGRARAAALRAPAGAVTPTSLVEYRSSGQLLVIAPEEQGRRIAAQLPETLSAWLLLPSGSGISAQSGGPPMLQGTATALHGHLGAFQATVQGPEGDLDLAQLMRTGRSGFDLVLDLSDPPLLRQDVLPAGYYAPGADPARLERALQELAELVGEFEKPRYFEYDPQICAHGRSGKIGCTRCLQACPTLAIRSAGERIEVDPYLCQGGGGCASACPSGAIRYAFPQPGDLLEHLRKLLHGYAEAGGRAAVLLFHDAEHGLAVVEAAAGGLPEQVLAIQVEEIGSVGLETWLAGLAFGAAEVVLLDSGATPPTTLAELRRQLAVCGAILSGLALEPERVRLLSAGTAPALGDGLGSSRHEPLCNAGFAAFNEKRTTIRMALDRLVATRPEVPAPAALPAGAPFGEIQVDRQTCTLCLACASVCPAGALLDGGEAPRLRFIELNCLQCGLCQSACPEDAVRLYPRMLYDGKAQRTPRVLNEDAPFHCLDCGKPFATRKIIQGMQAKLQGHWMFQSEQALRRLQLCEECRVKDMFRSGDGKLS